MGTPAPEPTSLRIVPWTEQVKSYQTAQDPDTTSPPDEASSPVQDGTLNAAIALINSAHAGAPRGSIWPEIGHQALEEFMVSAPELREYTATIMKVSFVFMYM